MPLRDPVSAAHIDIRAEPLSFSLGRTISLHPGDSFALLPTLIIRDEALSR